MPKLIVDVGISNADVYGRPSHSLRIGGEGRVKADDVSSALDLCRKIAGKGEPVLGLTGEVRADTRKPRMLRVIRAMEGIIKVLETKRLGWGSQ